MFIQIDTNGDLTLQDVDNFKDFSIIDQSNASQHQTLNQISTAAEDNHFWIDAEAVINLSEKKTDQEWVDNFWNMLKGAEPYGYSNLSDKKVKAHIESND